MPRHTRQVLYSSDVVSIIDVRCRRCGAEVAGEESSATSDIVFTRRGIFLKHVAGREVVANSNHVLFFNSAEPYRVTHPTDGGDDCTVLSFRGSVLSDAMRERFLTVPAHSAPAKARVTSRRIG